MSFLCCFWLRGVSIRCFLFVVLSCLPIFSGICLTLTSLCCHFISLLPVASLRPIKVSLALGSSAVLFLSFLFFSGYFSSLSFYVESMATEKMEQFCLSLGMRHLKAFYLHALCTGVCLISIYKTKQMDNGSTTERFTHWQLRSSYIMIAVTSKTF